MWYLGYNSRGRFNIIPFGLDGAGDLIFIAIGILLSPSSITFEFTIAYHIWNWLEDNAFNYLDKKFKKILILIVLFTVRIFLWNKIPNLLAKMKII